MNIFVLDKDPKTAAEMLCDCHVRKMCVETAQILSGVMLRRGLTLLEGMPKPQNLNHPVIVAADASSPNVTWVWCYFVSLLEEHYFRFFKKHAYDFFSTIYYLKMLNKNIYIDCATLAKCCGDLDVSGLDIVSAYKKYYTEVKKPALQAKGMWHFTNRKDWTE